MSSYGIIHHPNKITFVIFIPNIITTKKLNKSTKLLITYLMRSQFTRRPIVFESIILVAIFFDITKAFDLTL